MLVDEILNYYMKSQEERFERIKDTFATITELVMCKKKAEFSRKFPTWNAVQPQILVGIIVHLGVQRLFGESFEMEVEKTFLKEIDGKTISGTVDILDKTNNKIIEIKYSKDVYNNQPYEHHVKQVRAYLWLTGLDEGLLLYVTPERIVEFEVSEPMTDEEIRELINSWSSPRYDWECNPNYCPYYKFCSSAKKEGWA